MLIRVRYLIRANIAYAQAVKATLYLKFAQSRTQGSCKQRVPRYPAIRRFQEGVSTVSVGNYRRNDDWI